MHRWLRLLLEWYQRKCNEKEGFVVAEMILEPERYGIHMQNRQVKVTVEAIAPQPEDDLWVITLTKLFL